MKDNVRLIIASDIHGSVLYTKKFLDIVANQNPDKIVLLGDLYYHGPRNALPNEYNALEVSILLNKFADKIIAIKGNCDSEIDEDISDFKMSSNVQEVLNGKHFFFTHGHKVNIDNLPKEYFDVLMYGHYHTGFIKNLNNKIICNPGSISIPKGGTVNSFIMVDDERIYLMDLLSENIIDSCNY